MGLIGTILQPIYAGFPTYLMSPFAFVQRPARWLKAISRFGATTVGAPNFAFDACTDRVRDTDLGEIDLSSVRVLFCGAEPIRKDTLERFGARFAARGLDPRALYPCYGLAESTLFVTGVERGAGLKTRRSSSGPREFVSCGRTRAGTEIRIVDPARLAVLPDGEIGEVWVRGSSLASGYWGRKEMSDATFGATLQSEPRARWLRTGDLGFLVDGDLHPTGRLKDIIIVAGRKLACEDIEFAALTAVHAGADRAAIAYPVSTEDGTEAIALVIELVDHEAAELITARDTWTRAVQNALSQELDVALAELHIVRRGDLLRTTSGKVERRASCDAFLERSIPAQTSWVMGRWTA
jgi:acyl-CoA synthetase (AMP-forming)/AMP-acid ligase II